MNNSEGIGITNMLEFVDTLLNIYHHKWISGTRNLM